MKETLAVSSVDELVALYETWGHDHYDEAVSQLDHALQTAALAVAERADEPLVIAALLHDVGHLLELANGRSFDRSDRRHQDTGADLLSELFGPDVTEPIRLHVAAKRYRCAIEPDYLGSLSPASIQSLAAQGGPFSQEQAHEFARSDHAAAAVTLRGWDDRGKVEGLVITPLDAYRPLLQKWALA